jgi:hypothetical protein
MIRYFQLEVEELQATANGEILKSEQVEMLMMHFSGASYWTSYATDEGFSELWSTSKEPF